MKEVAPCKDCADRHLACHDSCEKYKEWRDRYHAQQKHYEDNRFRMNVPMTESRSKALRNFRYSYDYRRSRGGKDE